MTTAADIRCALRLRYPAGSHALLWEVANGTGSNQRRFADAVAVGLWPSHGHEIEGVEIKVSRGDWARELEQPEKSQEIFQYCNRWWLAAPKGLIAADELPTSWGLLELVGDVMRVKKKAPALKPRALAVGFVAALLRRHAGADAEMTEKLLVEERARLQRESEAEVRRKIESERQSMRFDNTRALEKLSAIKEATGFDFCRDFRPTEQWIAALKFLIGHSFDEWFTRENLLDIRKQCAKLVSHIDAMPGEQPPQQAVGT